MLERSYVDALSVVHSYASHIDDWVSLKRQLLLVLKPSERKSFSTRDPKTFKQGVNDFEKEIMEKWCVMTGRELILMHDDKEKI